ncbi:pentapeptide repeat-containing protein [Frankia nepalensis]|uniref:pentapeptide repeat-containing protein n=1 Tax=Frankia nepalensis TaxID=1836974 RepID=UPI00288B2FE8|nr:pentapeptide repeat-containing protein [Frankia nepalensis]
MLAVAGLAGLGAVMAVVAIWHLPDRMYTDQAAQASLQGGLLTAAAALTAVAGGLIALDETRRANANTHVREFYVEAVKLLNDPDNLGVRLAGIYALERVAVDSPADQRTIVEVLSAFVRENASPPAPDPADAAAGRRYGTDVKAAVTVLGRLPARSLVPRAALNLLGGLPDPTVIPRADLGGVDLPNLVLMRANLTGASLTGANLAGALLNWTNLSESMLVQVNLRGALLEGTNLTRVRLDEAELTGASLKWANLTGAMLNGANLTDATLTSADLTRATLDGADLSRARGLRQTQVDVAEGNPRTQLPAGINRPAWWT